MTLGNQGEKSYYSEMFNADQWFSQLHLQVSGHEQLTSASRQKSPLSTALCARRILLLTGLQISLVGFNSTMAEQAGNSHG